MEKEVTKSYEICLPENSRIEGYFINSSAIFSVYDRLNDMLDCSLWDYRAYTSLLDNFEPKQAIMSSGELMSLLNGYLRLYDCIRFDIFDEDNTNSRSSSLADYPEFQVLDIYDGNDKNYRESLDNLEIPNFLLHDLMKGKDEQFFKDIKKRINELSELNCKKFHYCFDVFLYLAYKSIEECKADSVKKAPDVYVLLKYLSYKIDWVVLYKIYESLEYFAQLEHYPHLVRVGKDLRLSSKDERDKFATPVNMFSIIGFDARHGYQKVHPNCKTDVFSFDKARDFVINHVKKYLKWKFERFIQQEIFAYNHVQQYYDNQIEN